MSYRSSGGIGLFFAFLFLIPCSVFSQDSLFNLVQWKIEDGGNGHWYAIQARELSYDWAQIAAQNIFRDGKPGYLATITSRAENDFIYYSVIGDITRPPELDRYYIGGQFDGYYWHWNTGEPWIWTNFNRDFYLWDWQGETALINGKYSRQGWQYWYQGKWSKGGHGCSAGSDCLWGVVEWGEPDNEPPDSVFLGVKQDTVSGHWYGLIPLARTWGEHAEIASRHNINGLPGHIADFSSEYENWFILNMVMSEELTTTDPAFYYLSSPYSTGQMPAIQSWYGGPVGPGHIQYFDTTTLLWAVIEWDSDVKIRSDSNYVRLSQWKVADGGNDHWYALIPRLRSHADQMAFAGETRLNGISGSLATITSQSENDFIANWILRGAPAPGREEVYYIGGTWDGNSWHWTTGEPWGFTNWTTREPDNLQSETILGIYSERQFTDPRRIPAKWGTKSPYLVGPYFARAWAIIEWPDKLVCGDADNDGVLTFNDLVYLQSYYFSYGPPPPFESAGDINADGEIDIADIAGLAAMLTGSFPSPCGVSLPPSDNKGHGKGGKDVPVNTDVSGE